MFKLDSRTGFVLALIVLAAFARLVPHPPNFSPVAALALFAGAQLAPRWLAMAVPLAAMLLGDLLLGLHATLPAVYLAIAATVLIGARACRSGHLAPVAGGVLGSALLFFVLTNFAVWLAGGLYPPTVDGLLACYAAALPFFQNTLAGTAFYALLLFGALRLVQAAVPSWQLSAARSA